MDALLYIAAAMTGLWGVAHLVATRGVVAGFGALTAELRPQLGGVRPGGYRVRGSWVRMERG